MLGRGRGRGRGGGGGGGRVRRPSGGGDNNGNGGQNAGGGGGGGGRGGGGGGGRGRGGGGGGGGRGRGRGGRWTDNKDYEEMQDSDEVKNFFKRRQLYQRVLSGPEFVTYIQSAKNVHEASPNLRHQFLQRLMTCPFLEMGGPIVGSVMKLIGDPSSVQQYSQGLVELLDLFEEALHRIPHTRNTRPYVTMVLSLIEKVSALNNAIQEKMKSLKATLDEQDLQTMTVDYTEKKWPANLNFMAEPLLPDVEQLLNEDLDARFIIPIRGGFTSSAHYLETWFRLMMEDFMGPLRVAIRDFQRTYKPTDRFLRNVRLDGGYHYTFERVVQRDELESDLYLVEYAQEELKHINWSTTDRLRGDSLMVLSNDHFRTVRYAIIHYNFTKPAKRGRQVWLRVVGGYLRMKTFHGIEPMAFYEPTRCVLERLKVQALRLSRGAVLPMRRYVVRMSKEVRPPRHLTDRMITLPKVKGVTYETHTGRLQIKSLGLDFSQEEAMKLALTHELALIQGPPGTGKSYVGAMFVHIMMLNKRLWQTYNHGCILLLAYKNHAIDQFIGECESMGMDMSRTVRVGSRSNAAMYKYLLATKRREMENKFEFRHLLNQFRDKRREVQQSETRIKALERTLAEDNAIPYGYYHHFVNLRIRQEFGGYNEELLLEWVAPGYGTLDAYHQGVLRRDMTKERVLQNDMMEFILTIHPSIQHIEPYLRRWFYATWSQQAREEGKAALNRLRQQHEVLKEELQQLRYAQDIAVVHSADIIAMTTTGASKHAHLLDAVKPTIVLCEEAAEVLESHIVAPLTDGCKHIVLIGDHQQLRPSVSNYDMEKRNLSISLFERLITNDIPSRRLQIQHRMHPDIADLLVPHIYTSLENHPRVAKYPAVMGVRRRMHFFCHEELEQKVGEKSSCRNPHEAKYLVALCHYLLQQGYEPDQITILATYTGQMRLIKDKITEVCDKHPEPTYTLAEKRKLLETEFAEYIRMKNAPIKNMDWRTKEMFEKQERSYNYKSDRINNVRSKIQDVRVTTVDNYQGEECTIILLSFVRSNPQGIIGFLKMANRICVALSRAKHGFYAVGNFKLFARKVDLWQKLCQQLETSTYQKLSSKLEIECQIHKTVRTVTDPTSFHILAPAGGCAKKCDARLKCGHTCAQHCHPFDKDHLRYVCKQPCAGRLTCSHECKKPCNQDSDERSFFKVFDSSGNSVKFRTCQQCEKKVRCEVEIEITPSCGHTGTTQCYKESEYACQKTVRFQLECGHSKKAPCSTPTSQLKCEQKITETLESCGHTITRKCCDANPICKTKVAQRQSCGHLRMNECHKREDPENCDTGVTVTLPCKHVKVVPCSQKATALTEPCTKTVVVMLECDHSKGIPCHQSKSTPYIHQYSLACTKRVEVTLPCDHKKNVPCNERKEKQLCQEDVTKKLACKHEVVVKCSQKAVVVRCAMKIPKVLSCGHTAEVECHAKSSIPKCKKKKSEKLACGHTLEEVCPKFATTRLKGCRQFVEIGKRCGHKRLAKCSEKDAPVRDEPCEEKCILQCSHGIRCPGQCREPCRRCRQPCQNQCPHSKCTRQCWEDCNRTPCEEPCPKTLECGHLCGGYCGEVCPDKCSVCQGTGTGNERRICVLPCRHDFTLAELDRHMAVQTMGRLQRVMHKMCPQCTTLITHCPRYATQIRRYLQLTKLDGYTTLKAWYYCKLGGHFVNYPKYYALGGADGSHRCSQYIHLRDVYGEFEEDAADDSLDDNRIFQAMNELEPLGGTDRGRTPARRATNRRAQSTARAVSPARSEAWETASVLSVADSQLDIDHDRQFEVLRDFEALSIDSDSEAYDAYDFHTNAYY